MKRGSTPTLTFNLPFSPSNLKSAYITIKCLGVEIEKRLEDCKKDTKSISVTLTQEETLSLTSNTKVEVQLRVVTLEGVALVSDIFETSADRILKDGVIE